MKIVRLLPLLIFILSCQTVNYEKQEVLEERDELRGFRTYAYNEWEPAGVEFDKHYDRFVEHLDGSSYYPIWFNSIEKEMNAIIFTPEIQTKGTVLMIHGYAGNIRGFRYIANELLRQGYSVATLSLPGHGLAGGERGDIENFDNYGVVVNDFIKILKDHNLNPEYAIGHSTGCSSLIIYNQDYGWDFKDVVFIAPLIQSASYYPAKVIRFLTKPFIKQINTKWSGPLAVQVFPMHWFDQLIKWNKKLKKYESKDDNILLLQGEKDEVVRWKYNIKSITNLYLNTEVVKYKQGSHTMFMTDKNDGRDIINRIIDKFNY